MNPLGAPPNWRTLVDTAVAHVSAAFEVIEVPLNIERFRKLTTRPDADRVLQTILDHEFGHLVGLDRATSPARRPGEAALPLTSARGLVVPRAACGVVRHDGAVPSGSPRFSWSRARRRRAMMRRLAELDRIDALHGLGADPRLVPAPRRARHRRDALLAGLLTAVVLSGFVMFDSSPVGTTTRALIGLSTRPPYSVPLLDPGDGSYTFMHTQPGSKAPVTYDPCRVIEVQINPEGAPENYREYVDTAIEHVSEPSGLRMEVVGETDDRPSRTPRSTSGSGWKPVLVAWADDEEVPALSGDVAGLAGSVVVESLGRARYVTGTVTLDSDAFQRITGELGGDAAAQAIVDHEFGHLVGLDHVDDAGELMYADNIGRRDWGPGDLAGLSRLGRGRCG